MTFFSFFSSFRPTTNLYKSLFSFSILLVLIISCAQKEKAKICQEADWFELGRREASTGNPNKYLNSKIPLVCSDSDPIFFTNLYLNGYNQGLVEFCRPEIAFELGRSGRKHNSVCPKEYQKSFTKSYEKGKKFLELESANSDLTKKIDEMSSVPQLRRNKLLSKQALDELIKAKADNESQMQSLEQAL